VAIALHLHYVDLWPEIEILLSRWRTPFSLVVTLTKDDPELVARVRSRFPAATLRVVENSGRDVRPFLLLLEEGVFDSFDLVCKIHGKRSLRPGYVALLGELNRRATFLDLIASERQVSRISSLFREDARLGIVGPSRFLTKSRHGRPHEIMGVSRQKIETIAERMGAPIRGPEFDLFAGTMFWVRPEALATLRRLRLAENAFAAEAGRADGALEHAVEGLFNHAVRSAGFGVRSVAVDD
jgi:lipopolysaccharide biosynthesis protein